MSVYTTEGHTGVFTFCLGLCLLALIAAGMDSVLKTSSGERVTIEGISKTNSLNKAKIIGLKKQLKEVETERRNQQAWRRVSARVLELEKTLSHKQPLIGSLRLELKQVNRDFQNIQDEWLEHRTLRKQHVRKLLKGDIRNEFRTANGDVYQDVTVTHLGQDSLKIRYDGGFKEIPFTRLPQDLYVGLDSGLEKVKAAVLEERSKQEDFLEEKSAFYEKRANAQNADSVLSEVDTNQRDVKRRVEAYEDIDQFSGLYYASKIAASRARSSQLLNLDRSIERSRNSWKARARLMEQEARSAQRKIIYANKKLQISGL